MLMPIIVLTLVANYVTAEIPSYIHVCGRQNPNIDQCIVDSVQSLREKLCIGIPELNAPPIDPLMIDKITMTETANNKIYLKDLFITGLCEFDINSFHIDFEKNTFDLNLLFKHIRINATYDFDVRILVPIVQKGKIAITSDNVEATANMDMKIVTRNGKRYMYLSRLKINLNIKGYDAHYELNENDVSQLNQALNSFIGSNQKAIIAAVKSPLETVISKRILMLSNEIVKNFTYDELFPDRA